VAAQCERAEGYHIQAEMGLVELIPCGEGLWEIVGTCLHNLAMPFVRYRTGDLAVKGEQECPCGRKHPILSRIVGREGDFVLTPENNLISPLSLHFSFYHLDEISEGQIIQEDIDRLRIKVVPVAGISKATKAILIHELKSRLESPSMDLIVDVVEEIQRSSSGKKPFVISRLERQDQTQFASR
jgi:phenylacetate-CoA ligase